MITLHCQYIELSAMGWSSMSLLTEENYGEICTEEARKAPVAVDEYAYRSSATDVCRSSLMDIDRP